LDVVKVINFIDKNNKLNENKNSLNITYSRTVNIIVGYYPYPEMIHSFIMEIKNNLNTEMKNYTNVKGGMTNWDYFLNKDIFNKFLTFIINKHQISHPHLFKYFLEKYNVKEAWGNQIQKNDSLDYHTHSCWHGILYLTKGCDLIFPELNLKITPEPGDYYIFPPEILHGFNKCEEENNRYSLIFNLEQKETKFNFSKKIKNLD
jgi:hypothetical protein|tara:strand:- start:710 stop:1321 length:612 start_codon:yes stop_codon:yes gene_type:complete